MSKEIIISSSSLETRIAILEDDEVAQVFIERSKNQGILGNLYKGKVTKVLPGMQAAFVDIGLDRNAFLYVTDFIEDFEEYEELFEEPGEIPVDLLKPEGSNERTRFDSGRRQRRSRRGKRDGSPRERERGGPAAKKTAAPTRPSEAPPKEARSQGSPPAPLTSSRSPVNSLLLTLRRLGRGGDILPLTLPGSEASESRTWKPRREAEKKRPGEVRILSDTLEPAREASSPASSEELEERRAVLEHKPDKQFLATPARGRGGRGSRKKNNGSRNEPRVLIGDLLREGQEILVQISKEPIGKKGARITSHIALPGRYIVYMPTVDHVGVSRKIVSDVERQRLKQIVLKLRGDFERAFIVRTAGEGHSEEDFRRDMLYLTRLWEEIKSKADKSSAPFLIHSEPGLVERIIRDYVTPDFRAIRVDDEHVYARIVEFVNRFNPDLVTRVRLYNKKKPIFDEYGITAEIEKALKPKVWLKNGGYIVINQTEALVAIDVNTGKFVGSTNSLEDTITRTNLDAVKEVVRQIRLRDLGGIIVIDFIDMDERRNRQKVMEALVQELAKDKAPSKILEFNEFGLVAITRKRVRQSLERLLCQPCSCCHGTGQTKSVRTICYSIHLEVRKMLDYLGDGEELLIRCHPDVSEALRGAERDVLSEIEEMSGKIVSTKQDPLMFPEQFDIVEV